MGLSLQARPSIEAKASSLASRNLMAVLVAETCFQSSPLLFLFLPLQARQG